MNRIINIVERTLSRPFHACGAFMAGLSGALLVALMAGAAAFAGVVPHTFVISADGLQVTDQQTGLIWRRCPEGMVWDGVTCSGSYLRLTAQEALQRAAEQAARTGVPWRLPNRKELGSLVDRRVVGPAIDVAAFPGTPATNFWSSTPVADDPGSAWSVIFGEGYVQRDSRYFTLAVRLVRGGR